MGRESSLKEGVVMSHILFYSVVIFIFATLIAVEFFGVC